MRVLGFSVMWDKLKQDEFTTFRFKRRDKDWEVSERVQIVYKPRSKERKILGVALITSKALRVPMIYRQRHALLNTVPQLPLITCEEAIADGFDDETGMEFWLASTYGDRIVQEPMNKLTLKWLKP